MNIELKTLKNNYYRNVIETKGSMQLVLMSLNKGEDIPMEIHKNTTQFFRIESGRGKIVNNGVIHYVKNGSSIIIPPNTKHYVKQLGNLPLKLYTIYSPPLHKPNEKNKRQPK